MWFTCGCLCAHAGLGGRCEEPAGGIQGDQQWGAAPPPGVLSRRCGRGPVCCCPVNGGPNDQAGMRFSEDCSRHTLRPAGEPCPGLTRKGAVQFLTVRFTHVHHALYCMALHQSLSAKMSCMPHPPGSDDRGIHDMCELHSSSSSADAHFNA